MSDVAAVVSGDTALSVRVLRMANSAWYGGVDAISDLTTATARIGMRGIVNLALASAQANLYRTSRPEWQGFMEGLWRHSIASAHAADLLGRQGLDRSEHSPFVAALVHDIGKVVLFDLITAKYRGSVGRLGEDPVLLARVLDHFHRLVGVHAVQRWQMPLEYRCSTWHAVAPDEAPEYARRLAHTVALADAVANACGYAAFRPEPVNLGSHPSARFFMISRLTLDEICVRLNEELDTLLEMVGKP
jgi:HD-like signal output (HDOD) protein